MGIKGYFIQYKFILPENTKHSSYTYQKLFRALYGYTQNVCKSNGKTYKYHRRGVLSSHPYIHSGKNCVIIPPTAFTPLTTFFKTGKNPTHYWRGRGDWKAVYYMDEKTIEENDVISAFETLLDRTYVLSSSKEHEKLTSEIKNLITLASKGAKPDQAYVELLLKEANNIINNEWFKYIYKKSPRLSEFYSLSQAAHP